MDASSDAELLAEESVRVPLARAGNGRKTTLVMAGSLVFMALLCAVASNHGRNKPSLRATSLEEKFAQGYLDPLEVHCYQKILELGKGVVPQFGYMDWQFHPGIKSKFVNRSAENPDDEDLEWCSTAPGEGVPDDCKNPPCIIPAAPCHDKAPPPEGQDLMYKHPNGYYDPCSISPFPCTRGYDLLLWPDGADCDTPRVLFVHGGGWEAGSPWDASYSVHGSKIAHYANAVVMLIDYPLIGAWTKKTYGGKQRYVGDYQNVLDRTLRAWKWLASHGPHSKTCNNVPPPMFIAGDSSGGGTAMQTLLQLNSWKRHSQLQSRGYVFPTGAFFESPWTNLKCNTPTYFSNNLAAGPTLTVARTKPGSANTLLTGDLEFNGVYNWKKNGNKTAVGNPTAVTSEFALNALYYCGVNQTKSGKGTCGADGADLKDPVASPYWAPSEALHGLPPLYFATSATEDLAGDTSILAQAAVKQGAYVRAELFYGMWHTFPQWSEGCRPINQTGKPLQQALHAIINMGNFVQNVSAKQRTCLGTVLTGNGEDAVILRNLKGSANPADPTVLNFKPRCHEFIIPLQ
mmetsp:Transcript_88107/g.156211  ORF Transcript_88107/g.156211 Transcript_88107/m.156211 type:complete len:573 (+) Transcript_88107:86-1804(+)